MVTIDSALDLVRKLNANYNYCIEYSDAYAFCVRGLEQSDVLARPRVIFKDTGEMVWLREYIELSNAEKVSEFRI